MDVRTIERVHEPYLIEKAFLIRTARGRVATDRARSHLGLPKVARAASERAASGGGQAHDSGIFSSTTNFPSFLPILAAGTPRSCSKTIVQRSRAAVSRNSSFSSSSLSTHMS